MHIKHIRFTLALSLCLVNMQAYAHDAQHSNNLEAKYLVNFFDYITWPQQKTDTAPPINQLCLYGTDVIQPGIAEILEKEEKNNTISLTVISSITQSSDCRILYIHSNHYQDLNKLPSRQMLIVGNTPDILQHNGDIYMQEDQGHITLTIDLQNVKSHDLIISSKLLKLSRIQNKP